MRRFLPFVVAASLLLIVIVSVQSCKKDAVYPDICYQRDIQPIFITNCTSSGCHNAQDHKEGYDFTTYEGIMKGISPRHPAASEIWTAINRSGEEKMPPNGDLTADQKAMIKKWILMGAPQTTNCASACDTNVFTYSGGVKPLLDTYCRGCHNHSFQSGGIDLQDYSNVVPDYTSSPSILLSVCKHEAGFVPMPYNSPKMSDCEIRVFEKWIDAGAPNN